EYLPAAFPAVADLAVSNALLSAADVLGFDHTYGTGTTRDAYYVRDATLNERLREAGVVAAEMEAATLFIVGAVRGVDVGCVVATDSNIWLENQPTLAEKEALYAQGEKQTIATALRAVEILASQEGN
ncbi:MAG: nucleoside phosphorylase, partial [Chloroflexota bacterium]